MRAARVTYARPNTADRLSRCPSMTYSSWSLVETPTFLADVDEYWNEDERLAFFEWLANNRDAGVLIPGSGGCRKVRWSRPGMGKRSGVRVIYLNRPKRREIWLLLVYAKSAADGIPAHVLKAIRNEIDDD